MPTSCKKPPPIVKGDSPPKKHYYNRYIIMLSFIFSTAGYLAYYGGYWTFRAILSMLRDDPAAILLLPKYL